MARKLERDFAFYDSLRTTGWGELPRDVVIVLNGNGQFNVSYMGWKLATLPIRQLKAFSNDIADLDFTDIVESILRDNFAMVLDQDCEQYYGTHNVNGREIDPETDSLNDYGNAICTYYGNGGWSAACEYLPNYLSDKFPQYNWNDYAS